MLESAIGIAMVFYGSLVDHRLEMPYFILSSLKFSNQCVEALRFCYFFIVFADIGDQLVPFANRKITVWLSFEERMDRLLFVHVINSCRRGN